MFTWRRENKTAQKKKCFDWIAEHDPDYSCLDIPFKGNQTLCLGSFTASHYEKYQELSNAFKVTRASEKWKYKESHQVGTEPLLNVIHDRGLCNRDLGSAAREQQGRQKPKHIHNHGHRAMENARNKIKNKTKTKM